jgi:hypothetical protein
VLAFFFPGDIMNNDHDPLLAANDGKTNDERKAQKKGDTHWSQVGGEGPEAPKQPNERDESSSSQSGEALQTDALAQAAYADAAGPQQDTDRAPVTDQVYNESVVEGNRVGDDESATGIRDPEKSTSSEHR